MRALEEPALINACLVVLAGLLASGVAVLLAELPAGALREIRSPTNALYWAVTTLTTVGFGDIVAHSPAGRFVTVAWTLTSFVAMSVLSSLLTSSLTSARLAAAPVDALRDVRGPLCVEAGYPLLDAFLARDEATPTRLLRRSLGGCVDAVLSREAHAAISDRPALTWLMTTRAGGLPPMHISPQLSAHPCAFAYAVGSPLRQYANPAIVAAQADPSWAPFVEGMRTVYFGVPAVVQPTPAVEPINRDLVITVSVLSALFVFGQAVYMARCAGALDGLPSWPASPWGSKSSLRRATRALGGGGGGGGGGGASFGSAAADCDVIGTDDEGGGAALAQEEDGSPRGARSPSPTHSRRASGASDGGGLEGGSVSAAVLGMEIRALTEVHEASAAAMRARLALLEQRAAAGMLAGGAAGGGKAMRNKLRSLTRSVSVTAAHSLQLQQYTPRHSQPEASPFGSPSELRAEDDGGGAGGGAARISNSATPV
jgi:hypothetical protein